MNSKTLVMIVIGLAIGFFGWQLYQRWVKMQEEREAERAVEKARFAAALAELRPGALATGIGGRM